MDILSLAQLALTKGASDLHLVAGSPPVIRIEGVLQPVADSQPLTPDDISQVFQQIASEEERDSFEKHIEFDFSRTLPSVGRIRCNAGKQRGTNSMESRRVVTIEDPVEYIYSDDRCTITQRELGKDIRSFAEALKHVLRQDPDVILVGEVRDYDTASAVLTVAETGYLVLTTGHATSAAQAVERIIDLFPSHERPLAQARLASFLIAILCQTLVPKADGKGRVAAVEVMLAYPAIRNTIREGRIYQIPNAMVTQVRLGMVLLDSVLVRLYKAGTISYESMFAVCNDPEDVNKLLAKV